MTGALVQIGALIALGFGLRRSGFLGEPFWRGLERLAYFVLLPTLVFQVLAGASLEGAVAVRLALAVGVSILVVAVVLLAARPALGVDGPAFTSVFQGSVRFNSYVALAVIPAVFGRAGLELAALLIAAVVPLVNVLSVAVLRAFAGAAPPTPARVVRAVLTNPLVIACALGLAWNAALGGLPPAIDGAVGVLARAALPAGLMAVGAALTPRAFREHARGLALAGGAKFVLLPVCAALAGRWFRLPPEAFGALVLFQAQPTATSAYLLARQLGGDAELMASIVTGQTLVAFAVLPWVASLVAR